MHIELLVEEPSAEAALQILLPKIGVVSFAIHAHQGKSDLLAKLPARLKGYRRWLPKDGRIVVLLDEDRQDCRKVKQKLEAAAASAGLATKSSRRRGPFQVVNRLAVEELEAWFFGDIQALAAAYPGVPPTLASKAPYREPDQIKGGTCEALERVLRRAGHFPGGLAKIEAARTIAQHMDPNRNRSRSFRLFRDTLRELAG
jgi:hypothetical protein